MFDDVNDGTFNLTNEGQPPVPLHTNVKLWRVFIYESPEAEPILESFSVLTVIPSINEDNGAISFRNLMRNVRKLAKVEGKENLMKEYKEEGERLARIQGLTKIYEGRVNAEGCQAGLFNQIQSRGNDGRYSK